MQYSDALAYLDAHASYEKTGRIEAPTLVVTGVDDQRSTPTMAYRLAEALPRGEAVVVPDVRHLLPLEQPRLLAELVDEFLNRDPNRDPNPAEGTND